MQTTIQPQTTHIFCHSSESVTYPYQNPSWQFLSHELKQFSADVGVPLRDLDRTWLRQQMAVVTQVASPPHHIRPLECCWNA
eukprot:4815656-Amphidinium_carterae.1